MGKRVARQRKNGGGSTRSPKTQSVPTYTFFYLITFFLSHRSTPIESFEFAKKDAVFVMNVTVEYTSQIKKAAGFSRECYALEENATVHNLLQHIAKRHSEKLRSALFDEDGDTLSTVLIFVENEQANRQGELRLNENDTVTFLSPISGG